MGFRFNIETAIIFLWINYAINETLGIYEVVKTMILEMQGMDIDAMMASMSGSMNGSMDSGMTGGMGNGTMDMPPMMKAML